jgi:hypothetical protein
MALDNVIPKASLINSILSVCYVTHDKKAALLMGTFKTKASASLPRHSIAIQTLLKPVVPVAEI